MAERLGRRLGNRLFPLLAAIGLAAIGLRRHDLGSPLLRQDRMGAAR